MLARVSRSFLPFPRRAARLAVALAALAVVMARWPPRGGAGAVDAAPPAQDRAPSGVTATRSADGASATLAWAPATGAELQWVYAAQKLDPDEPDTYWDRLGIDTDTIKIHGRDLPGDTRTLEITGLHPGRAYQYGIATRTTNAAGQQTWSAWQRYNDIDTASCHTAMAVPDAASNPGLLSDCRTLLGLRDALQGNAARRLDWSVARPVADWDGITVAGTPPRVVSLDLDNRRLTGALPPALGRLDALQTLGLPDNSLYGTIPPELGNLANLEILDLHKNDLEGAIPSELGNLSQLRELYLSNNHIGEDNSSIPPELGQLQNLQHLFLFNNEIHGSIPPELGNLSSLLTMHLADNLLHEEIPPELGNLANLSELHLYDNHLEGSIPPELGNMDSLTQLDLRDNRLEGNIPSELSNLSSLIQLQLSQNRLDGPHTPGAGQPDLTGLVVPGQQPAARRNTGGAGTADRAACAPTSGQRPDRAGAAGAGAA